MISVDQLTKHFGPHVAVNSISFTARQGEVLGILGPNGAGKTTTMRMLTGFIPPDNGTATIAGFDILNDSLEVRRRVGYLPEAVPLYPDMTVYAYIRFWAELRGMRRPHQRVLEVIDQVQLSERRNSLIRTLSKGMRQRLGLAQAIVHQPEVIILDEPTIGIDPQQVIEVRQQVRQLGQQHTVIFSTHILSEAEQVCDRVLIMNNGRILAEGPPTGLRRLLQPEDHLYIEVQGGPTNQAAAVLTHTPGVDSVVTDGSGFNIRTQASADQRSIISAHLAEAGFHIIEMRPVAMTLEDIFLDLVGRSG